ncbi:MAG: DNA mismatch endonuclease Vsr [Planctomycetes bacterium]|nr:DNA mismatch endonuclease Vsr [Planctomycetota bacterium]
MADRLTRRERSLLMSKIRGKDTQPEMKVRRLVHSLGFRYRLHVASLPGSPDLVFASRKKIIFVHGCFWHDHGCSVAGLAPQTNQPFWQAKFSANRKRDQRARRQLRRLGWRVLVVWECQVRPRDLSRLQRRIISFLEA